jgi:hypothetical protein
MGPVEAMYMPKERHRASHDSDFGWAELPGASGFAASVREVRVDARAIASARDARASSPQYSVLLDCVIFPELTPMNSASPMLL